MLRRSIDRALTGEPVNVFPPPEPKKYIDVLIREAHFVAPDGKEIVAILDEGDQLIPICANIAHASMRDPKFGPCDCDGYLIIHRGNSQHHKHYQEQRHFRESLLAHMIEWKTIKVEESKYVPPTAAQDDTDDHSS